MESGELLKSYAVLLNNPCVFLQGTAGMGE
jgi:hypothetical protein